eukprot:Gb_12708 [translate_table: standard]
MSGSPLKFSAEQAANNGNGKSSSRQSSKKNDAYMRLYVEFMRQEQRLEEEKRRLLEQYKEKMEREKPVYSKDDVDQHDVSIPELTILDNKEEWAGGETNRCLYQLGNATKRSVNCEACGIKRNENDMTNSLDKGMGNNWKKVIRVEVERVHHEVMAIEKGIHTKIQTLLDRCHFLRVVYKHHNNAEDEVIFLALDMQMKNVALTCSLEHKRGILQTIAR